MQKEKINIYNLKPQKQGTLTLQNREHQSTLKLTNYLKSSAALWYWIVIVIAFTAVLIVLLVPNELYPLTYAKNILGIILVLWLPGYTLVKALFPEKEPASNKSLDIIQRIALSIGVSLVIVPFVGLLLYYTPFGLSILPLVLSLFGLTLLLATLAMARDYQIKSKPQAGN
jgi:uncharacterized membrane protein